MIEWVIFLVCLVLILFMPCGLYAHYCSDETIARLIIGPLRINLLKSRPAKSKSKKQKATKSKPKNKSNKLNDFLPLIRLVLNFLSDFQKKLVIKNLQFKMILGGSDPCNLSINYGRYWAILGGLFPHLESWFTIKKRNIEIECDYTTDTTTIDASIDIRLKMITLLHMLIHHGIRILTKYLKITNKAKDGAVS